MSPADAQCMGRTGAVGSPPDEIEPVLGFGETIFSASAGQVPYGNRSLTLSCAAGAARGATVSVGPSRSAVR